MKITKKSIEKLVQAQIETEQSYIEEHEQIAEILKKVEGKQFNGHALNKRTLGDSLTFRSQYGMFHIDGKYSHLIGYHSTPAIDVEKFREWDACHGSAAKERIEKLRNIDKDALLRTFRAIEKHYEALRAAFGEVEREDLGSYHNPIYYDLLRLIHSDDKHLRLTDFYYLRK